MSAVLSTFYSLSVPTLGEEKRGKSKFFARRKENRNVRGGRESSLARSEGISVTSASDFQRRGQIERCSSLSFLMDPWQSSPTGWQNWTSPSLPSYQTDPEKKWWAYIEDSFRLFHDGSKWCLASEKWMLIINVFEWPVHSFLSYTLNWLKNVPGIFFYPRV